MGKRKVSCLPCRLKKVKCTGEIPCERCRRKNIKDCIIPPPGAVGRPPKNGVVKRVNATIAIDQTCREFIFENCLKTQLSSSSQVLKTSIAPTNFVMEFFFTNYCTRATRLLDQFRQQYALNANQSKRKIQIIQANCIQDLIHLFSHMSSGLVDLFIQKVSKIKATYYSEAKFVIIGLALDETSCFFDSISPSISVDPLKSLPTEQGLELIEYFFCLNPQSITINKTMLIESYWSDTVNPLLLSVIYGTAIYTSSLLKNEPLKRWGASYKSERNLFLNYAHTLLQRQQGSNTGSDRLTLSNFQAVVLLATFESMFGYPKKGTSLLGLAYMMATELGVIGTSRGVSSTLSKIEKELLGFTFWSAFHGTIRGCMELEQVPREILANHTIPYPPVNLYSSASLRLDMMSGHTRLLKIDNYLVETFYIQSVTALLTCRFQKILPYSKLNEAFKKQDFKPTLQLTSNDQQDKLSSMEFSYPCKDIRLGLENILCDFKQFMDETKATWSRLQEFNFDLTYLIYSFALVFLKDEYNTASTFQFYTEGRELARDGEEEEYHPDAADHKRQMEEGLVICKSIVEKSLDFLESTSNYCDDPTFVPKRLLMCCLDIASQLFIYSMKTDKTDKTSRYQLNHILSILWRDDIWDNWPPARTAIRAIESFLKSKISDKNIATFVYSSPSGSLLDLLSFDGIF